MVASKHYWQVTPEDFERAIRGSSKAAHNPAQYLHVSARTDSQSQSTSHEKTPPRKKKNPGQRRGVQSKKWLCFAEASQSGG